MKTKHKITKEDLVPSTTLSDAGVLIFTYKKEDGTVEECPIFAIVSEPCNTEQEALDSLNKKIGKLLDKIVGNDYYSMNAEIKIWHEKLEGKDVFVADEKLILPGLDATTIRSILSVSLI